jgi:hypothetical protein
MIDEALVLAWLAATVRVATPLPGAEAPSRLTDESLKGHCRHG